MHKHTETLLASIRRETRLENKLELLKNAYSGEDCYILTGGPSVKEIPVDKLMDATQGKLVIAVKQTYNIVPEAIDFHIINPYNYEPYSFINDPVRIRVEIEGSKLKTPQYDPDLTFEIDQKTAGIRNASLASTMDYENYTLENTTLRPWGPGIMHELVVYLPILLGCKRVYIMGWDLGSPNSEVIDRFYGKNRLLQFVEKFIVNKVSRGFYNRYIIVINFFRNLLSKLGFKVLLNEPSISEDEASFIAKSTAKLYQFFMKHGLDVKIISSTSMVDDAFPRTTL